MSYVIPNETTGHPLSASRDGDKAHPAATVYSSSFSRSVTPVSCTVTKSPNHVIINQTGSYSFTYSCTESLSSIRGNATSLWEQGIVIDSGAPIRLDISPCAWSGSVDNLTGNVSFVYKGR